MINTFSFMINRLQMYEQHILDTNHYKRLLLAKSTITGPKQSQNIKNQRISPLDKYQYQRTNDRIRKKLVEIYQGNRPKVLKTKNKITCSLTLEPSRLKQKDIDQQNSKMFERLVKTKSVVREDWNQRQKSLRKYSQITRKKNKVPDDTYFLAFREILVQKKLKRGRKLKHKAKDNSHCQNRDFSGKRQRIEEYQLRQTL